MSAGNRVAQRRGAAVLDLMGFAAMALVVPEGALLVEVELGAGGQDLPRAPAPHRPTVTLSGGGAQVVLDLRQRGYEVVARRAPLSVRPVVHVLVQRSLREAQPEWLRGLLEEARRAYDLDLGPVREVLGPLLDAHLRDEAG